MSETSPKRNTILSSLISTTKLLNCSKIKLLLEEFPQHVVTNALRDELQQLREKILYSSPEELETVDISPERIEEKVDVRVRAQFRPSIRMAINATGIILHTGLGRAPFAKVAQELLLDAVNNYCTLEVDVSTGKRGERYIHVEGLLNYITGAEAGCVVNNNAGAVLLVLNTLAEGREVIISRGQLIEIGGAFRMPDVMRQSGVIMVEVGTTNRTHLHDYENALTEKTALIQVTHTSNYKFVGFYKQVPLSDLKILCIKRNIPLVKDIGSGALIELEKYSLPPEPTVQDGIKDGADIVTFSGDKLIGGPQCGIIVGKKEYIDRIKKNPLCRALRCDKMTYAVLEATLKLFLDEKRLLKENPVMQMLTLPVPTIASRARRFIRKIRSEAGDVCEMKIINGESQMGGGSLPGEQILTKLVALKPIQISTNEFSNRLRMGDPSVFTRIAEGEVLLDFRTIHPDEINSLGDVVVKALKNK